MTLYFKKINSTEYELFTKRNGILEKKGIVNVSDSLDNEIARHIKRGSYIIKKVSFEKDTVEVVCESAKNLIA